MTREIKFRVWCNRTKKWLKDDEYGLLANGKLIARSEYNEVGGQKAYTENSSVDATICFWTGLKDKNGKEIYEGDILKLDSWEGVQVVDFIEGAFCLTFANGKYKGEFAGDIHYIQHADKQQSTIIGNIYSNPELIK